MKIYRAGATCRPVQSVLLCASCAGIAILTACGGGSSSTLAISTPTPTPLNCSLQIEAFDPPTPSDNQWNAFQTYVLPAVSGVDIVVPWNSIETTSQGQYPGFAALDSQFSNYQGKKINLIFQPISYSNINNPSGGANIMTPSYVFTSSWATSAGASSPQDVAYCATYPGNNTFVNTTANASTPGFDSSGYPVVYEAPFQVAYQNFISAALQHYKGNSSIGYMRFGLSVGNETDAYCTTQLESLLPPGTDFTTTWENWISTMDSYEKSVLPNPPIQLMESLNRLDTDPTGTAVPDFEAATAVTNGFGFGNNGLQKSDITASASGASCTGDWCAMFDKYAGQVPLELQTATRSDPSGSDPSNPTGNLVDLIPVAAQHHATILEVLMPDLYLAFDPNYAPPNPADLSFAGTYKTTLTSCGASQ
jgi:hypothetical protein